MTIKKNDIFETEILDYTTEGSGVCKVNNFTVFVPNTAIGDRVEIRILKVLKSYAFGKIEKILSPSSSRTTPDCPVSEKCGGCTFRHITYESELKFKQKRVYDALTRIGGIDGSLIQDIVGSEKTDGYRNKVQLPVTKDKDGNIRLGFFAPKSHRVIPLDGCFLQSEAFSAPCRVFLEWANQYRITPYDEASHTGILRHLYLRYAEMTGELMVCIVANTDELRHEKDLVSMLVSSVPEITTIVLNSNKEKTNVITGKKCRTLYGNGYITDILCGLRFRISPLSFYQVNRTQAEKLYTIASEFASLKHDDFLLDLYCGTGTIGLSMADKADRLIGVEIIPQAIEDAKRNASENEIKNAEFICADASLAAKRLDERRLRPDCIILDPPRKGCERSLIETVAQMSPERIVYVSCDPATLARDVRVFSDLGFFVKKAVPVDMFPRTTHVETVCCLYHQKKDFISVPYEPKNVE